MTENEKLRALAVTENRWWPKNDWLTWHTVDRKNRKDGKMWQAQISNWIRCQVWPDAEPGQWAWKVGVGGTQGMAWVSVAPSEDAAIQAAEAFLKDKLATALKGHNP